MLYKHSRAEGVAEDVEVFFPVGVAVSCVVGADYLVLEALFCSFVEAGGEGVGLGLPFGGIAGPAGGGVPAGAVAGGVDVYGDEEDVGSAVGGAVGVGAADAFLEGDVVWFGDEELGVVAFGLEGCEDLRCEVAGVEGFDEAAVWGAFAGGVVAVGGV